MKYLFPVIISIFLIVPLFVSAAQPCITCDCLNDAGLNSAAKLCNFLDDIGFILYVAGAGLAVIMVIIGGIKYMTAGDSEDKAKSGRKTIINGLIGAAIILASGFIVGLVNDFIANRLLT
jgi:uncharacterized membrane protein YhaH (DUF805 family)